MTTTRIAAVVGSFAIALTTWAASTPAHADQLPACAQEDGNIDGQPCTWTDPDTGRGLYVTSENYR